MLRALQGWKFSFILFVTVFCEGMISSNNSANSGESTIGSAIIPDCDLGSDSVGYYIFSREIPDGIIVKLDSPNIPVKPDLVTIFLVHGFTSEANTSRYVDLINTFVDQFDVNVISVDWKHGACTAGGISLTRILSYPAAVVNVRSVGEKVSKFISRLVKEYKMKLEDINLIGHSLGGHVVGFAGKDLQKKGIGTIHHILGLDPAGPAFESNSCSQRLCKSDADFVQIFHTSYAFGIHRAVGNIDFYFNGGRNQPQCPVLLQRLICSHSSAIDYLIDILQKPDCKFVGKRWSRSDFFPPTESCTEETCSIPGPWATLLPNRGTFYVNTEDRPAFCSNH